MLFRSEKAADEAVKHGYAYSTPEDDRRILRTVLTSETDLEKEQRQEDAAIRKNNPDGATLADAGTKRTAGMNMSQVSGGAGRYRETSSSKKHPLFRKRQRR